MAEIHGAWSDWPVSGADVRWAPRSFLLSRNPKWAGMSFTSSHAIGCRVFQKEIDLHVLGKELLSESRGAKNSEPSPHA
jgi:hypothetical protein